MDKLEAYAFLFMDSFSGVLVFPHFPFVFYMMDKLGGYNHILMVLFATLGSVTGFIFNWVIGRALSCCPKSSFFTPKNKNFAENLKNFFIKYGYFLLVLSFVPVIGPLITVIAGIFRLNLFKFSLILIVVQIIYFSIKLI